MVDAFFREPPNRGVGSLRFVLVHPQGSEFVRGHFSSSILLTPAVPAAQRRSSLAEYFLRRLAPHDPPEDLPEARVEIDAMAGFAFPKNLGERPSDLGPRLLV